ncbi:hypothetical protein CY35_09G093400 [Sphagnum magellanicum]|nr:hypothetical protein CY35_09G093400 [Sphagnum magellanicum]
MQRCGGHSRNLFALLQLLQGGSKLRGCDGWRTLWGWTIDVERPAISGIGRPCGAFLDHHAHHPQSAGVGGEGLQQLLLRPDCLWRQQTRQVKVNGSEVKPGNVIDHKGRIFQVLKTQHTQQGRGGATIQVELRDLASGLKSSERLRTSESIERVFVEDKTYTFLYAEGDSIILMEPKSFEQVTLLRNLLGTGAAYLADGMEVVVQLYDGQPFSAKVPARVTCSVIEAEPYFKGQTATPTCVQACCVGKWAASDGPIIHNCRRSHSD